MSKHASAAKKEPDAAGREEKYPHYVNRFSLAKLPSDSARCSPCAYSSCRRNQGGSEKCKAPKARRTHDEKSSKHDSKTSKSGQ